MKVVEKRLVEVSFDQGEIEEALLSLARENCCWPRGFIKASVKFEQENPLAFDSPIKAVVAIEASDE